MRGERWTLPLYHDGEVAYCRSSDLPDEARPVFERWIFGQTTPVVPGIRDACYPSDMARFLS
jgi:hypothetical protein